jgi:hypothetical protein
MDDPRDVAASAEPTTMAAPDKPIPLGVAIALLAAFAAIGGGLIWRYVYRPANPSNAIRTLTPLPENPRVAGGPDASDGGDKMRQAVIQTAAEAELPDGIHPRGAGDALVKAGDAYLRVVARDKAEPGYTFGYFTVEELEWEHGYLSAAVRRVLGDDDAARDLGVTPEQKQKLEALAQPPAARWPEVDRKRFVDAFRAWERAADASKATAGHELVAGLREYAQKRRWGDQQVMQQRVALIKATLTERQQRKVNPLKRWELPSRTSTGPATQP